MQMPGQGLRKTVNEAPNLPSVIILRKTRPTILHKAIEPRRESSVLLYIPLHDALDTGYEFDAGEEKRFLGLVVVVHGFAPALAVGQEVADYREVGGREVRRLEGDGVEAAEDAVVGEGHLRGDVVGRVGGLGVTVSDIILNLNREMADVHLLRMVWWR